MAPQEGAANSADAPFRIGFPEMMLDDRTKKAIASFHNDMGSKSRSWPHISCSVCRENWYTTVFTAGETMCSRCRRDSKHPKCWSDGNNVNPETALPCWSLSNKAGLPPNLRALVAYWEAEADVLPALTMVEQSFIAPHLAVMYSVRLRGGQTAFSNHVLAVRQDLQSMVTQLPRYAKDTNIIVMKSKRDGSSVLLQVRRKCIHQWLVFLKYNNKFMAHIDINEDALASIPLDGQASGFATIEDEAMESSDPDVGPPTSDNATVLPTFFSGVLDQQPQQSEKQHVDNFLDGQHPSNMSWPTRQDVVNELSPGYLTLSFPYLFPTGRGDFTDVRDTKVNLHAYTQHLLKMEGGRFLNQPQFAYLMFNIIKRKTLRQTGQIFLENNPEVGDLSSEDLTTMLGQPDCGIVEKIRRFASSVTGTSGYFRTHRLNLQQMCNQLGQPQLFLTFSAADSYWPDLDDFLRRGVPLPSEETFQECRLRRHRQLIENPALADQYFVMRMKSYIKNFLEPVFGVVDHFFRFEFQHRGSPHAHGVVWLRVKGDWERDIDLMVNRIHEQAGDIDNGVFETYIDRLSTSWNPAGVIDEQVTQSDSRGPQAISRPYDLSSSSEALVDELKSLLGFCQRHQRCNAYCLRPLNLPPSRRKCKARFPRQVNLSSPTVSVTEQGTLSIITRRNDPWLVCPLCWPSL